MVRVVGAWPGTGMAQMVRGLDLIRDLDVPGDREARIRAHPLRHGAL